jgi:hypothetical protein
MVVRNGVLFFCPKARNISVWTVLRGI